MFLITFHQTRRELPAGIPEITLIAMHISHWLGILISFYWLGYVVAPLTLYRGRWKAFLVNLIILHLVVFYQSQGVISYLAQRYELETGGVGVARIYLGTALPDMVSNIDAIVFHKAFNLHFVALPLCFKLAKDGLRNNEVARRLKQENLRLELNLLRSQISPHFLFNTLNNIYARVIGLDDRAARMLVRLSDMMRYALYETGTDLIRLDRELQFMKDYIQLERIRHRKPVRIGLSVEGEVQEYSVPPFLLVMFVENAFKHGLNRTGRPAWVDIQVQAEANLLRFSVRNSRSDSVPTAPAVGGLGLENVRKRLKFLYPDRHRLVIEPSEQEYSVQLTLWLV
ncbi:sensor histidine kinase [Larkinella soli]|uniref:sensor histidine kinase n=1 Tax=Larkinella soli TaxID=1770527 RepID=UPI000FFBA297|nr:histidine kinase [Larkinella soli]